MRQKGGLVVPIELIRSRIYTERERPPKPIGIWLQRQAGASRDRPAMVRGDRSLLGIEPANCFHKERLYAELPKVRQAESSDHWLMGMQLIETTNRHPTV